MASSIVTMVRMKPLANVYNSNASHPNSGAGGCVNETFECDGKMDCADNSDELTEKCDPKFEDRLHGNCSAEEFQCQSDDCITLDSLCDGSPECLDRSDEIVLFCSSNVCPPFGFRCGYGGCIDGRRQCDGVFDCADDSDENAMLCAVRIHLLWRNLKQLLRNQLLKRKTLRDGKQRSQVMLFLHRIKAISSNPKLFLKEIA